ncbi:DUF6090 family protein [Balneola sp. MJW-20]|uniref:DUF6090 family protein n=1 Tax=Gracilimonas aurantiaca TaxID=3234185 RepID=UPI0034663471
MVTLFRRIREKLIASGSVTKYLLYAIGEILLVVVGILIALQVNNWNELEKREEATLTYHQRLSEDLDLLLADAEDSREYASENFEAIKISLNALNRGQLAEDEVFIFTRFLNRYFKFALNIQELNTYKEMQSAGKLELIRDLELRDGLASLIDFIEFFNEVHRTFHRDTHLKTDYIDPYLLYTFSPDSSDIQSSEILYNFDEMAADRVLIRKISRQAMLWKESVIFHNRLISETGRVKELLDREIEILTEQ